MLSYLLPRRGVKEGLLLTTEQRRLRKTWAKFQKEGTGRSMAVWNRQITQLPMEWLRNGEGNHSPNLRCFFYESTVEFYGDVSPRQENWQMFHKNMQQLDFQHALAVLTAARYCKKDCPLAWDGNFHSAKNGWKTQYLWSSVAIVTHACGWLLFPYKRDSLSIFQSGATINSGLSLIFRLPGPIQACKTYF